MDNMDNIELSKILRPYVPFNWIVAKDYMKQLKFDPLWYSIMTMLSKLQVESDFDEEKRRSVFEDFYNYCDDNSDYVQVYGHLFLRNIGRFRLVLVNIGFVDYIEIFSDGRVEVYSAESSINKIGKFNSMLDSSLEFIPVVFKDFLDDNTVEPNADSLIDYYAKICALWDKDVESGFITSIDMSTDDILKSMLDSVEIDKVDRVFPRLDYIICTVLIVLFFLFFIFNSIL